MTYHAITQQAVIIRILAAVLVGGLIGFERGMKNRPAGLRTYMLVCVGSCLIMMTNQYIFQVTGAGDPMRLGAQVISGIGFLGTGTIVVTRHNQIKGLTTAAGLWACAGVGLALGIGFYEAVLWATIGIFTVLVLMRGLDDLMCKRLRNFVFYIELSDSVSINSFAQNLRAIDIKVEQIEFEPEDKRIPQTHAFVVILKPKKRESTESMAQKIRQIEGVVHIEEI